MAHDHRMKPVGEPHLNVRNRKVAEGRNTDLYNLKNMLVDQLRNEWDETGSVFSPDFDSAVTARLENYREGRNYRESQNEPLSPLDKDTRNELADRIRNRHNY